MQEHIICESCNKLIPRNDATWWQTPIVSCWLCEECVAIQPDEYADHFVDLWEYEEAMRNVASDLEEPHRTKLLDAIGRLSDVIEEVNETTNPTLTETKNARATDV